MFIKTTTGKKEIPWEADDRTPNTEELQKQKNSKNRRTPTTAEPQFFKYFLKMCKNSTV
jgi:hypothetical protein